MTRRQPYDAATPYYGEPQLYEKEIAALKARAERAEEAAGDFQELERINAGLIRERDAAEAKVTELAKEVAEWRSRPDALRADKAEAKVAKLREALEAVVAERKLAMAVEVMKILPAAKRYNASGEYVGWRISGPSGEPSVNYACHRITDFLTFLQETEQ